MKLAGFQLKRSSGSTKSKTLDTCYDNDRITLMKPTSKDLTFLESLTSNPELRSQLLNVISESVKIDSENGYDLLAVGPFTATVQTGSNKTNFVAMYLLSGKDFAGREGHYTIDFSTAMGGDSRSYLISPEFKVKITENSISFKLGDESLTCTPFNETIAKEELDTSDINDIVDYTVNGPEPIVEDFDDE